MTIQQSALRGREALKAWEADKPDNFFTSDTNLQYVIRRLLGDGGYLRLEGDLAKFGAECATEIDDGMKLEDLVGNHPRLKRFNGIGERIEQIEFHPNHDVVGEKIWKSGIMAIQREPGNTVQQMALFYLLNHTADGHSCGLACTSGLIRILQNTADDWVLDKFLPPLLDPDYDNMHHGAQFLTEVQGGSDVGANGLVARDAGDGTWRLTGEKWFCSNINADQFLVMARPEDAPEGTRGLGAFLVPRQLDDGTTNGFYLRRLKEKLGTRTLASAEVDFVDAVAYPIGKLDEGFKNTVSLVLNTSRLMNAMSCAGFMRRAYIEAASYACHREAFGGTIAQYPLVQETVADIMAEYYASVSSGFTLAKLLDDIETGRATDDDNRTYRMFVNLNKYITSINGTYTIHKAIEVLGGNGAIETFSILPRLYRDMLVLESWEGTHNVLILQVMRDIARYQVHEPFIKFIQSHLDTVTDDDLKPYADAVRAAIDRAQATLGKLSQADQTYREAHARRLADLFSYIGQAGVLLAEAQWELDNDLSTHKPDVAAHFINSHLVPGYDPMLDEGYLGRIERLMMAW